MANQTLRYIAELEAQGFVKGSKEMNNALKKMEKAAGRQSRGFTQMAYALDDAQYGFRGVQNNLQQLAVQAGLGGPVILGLTALIVVIGKVIDNFESANKQLVEAKKNFKELTKVILSSDEQIIRDGKKIQEDNEKQAEQLRAQLKNGKTLSHTRKDGTAVIRDLTEAERELKQTALDSLDEQISSNGILIQQAKTRIQNAKDLKKIKDSEDVKGGGVEFGLNFGPDPGLFDVFSDRGVEDPFGLSPDPEVLDEWDDFNSDLEAILKETGSHLAGLSEDQAKAFLEIEAGQQTSAEKSQEWAGAMIGAFESAASQGGNFLENLAKGLLSSLGSILIQQGTAAIFSGIAKNAIVPGSGTDSIKKGALVAAAGVALKAGANIAGSKGAGGSSNSPGSRSSVSAPASGFSGGGSGGTVTFEIGNDKLIGSLEQGLNKRGTFLGTNQLTTG